MKRKIILGICLFLCCGCVAEKELDLKTRLENEYYKEESGNYEKEMIGVEFSFLSDGTFMVSNKGNYRWKDHVAEHKTCQYDFTDEAIVEGSKCNKKDLEKIQQIKDSFDQECKRLDTNEEELNKFFQ